MSDPERLGGWLATTVRRECLQILRRPDRRAVVVADFDGQMVTDGPDVDETLLIAERDAALWAAVAQLPEGCATLLRVLMAVPPPSYGEVATELGMSIGSIGPTRQRCLHKLRAVLDVDGHTWTEDWS